MIPCVQAGNIRNATCAANTVMDHNRRMLNREYTFICSGKAIRDLPQLD